MSVDVLTGADKYAIQLKRLETEGQAISQSNFMVESNPGNTGWNLQGAQTTQPYFTSDIGENTGAQTLSFELTIDASTPADVYDLEFAIAGKSGDNLFYQDEHFYLAVAAIPEPATISLMGIAAVGCLLTRKRNQRIRAGKSRFSAKVKGISFGEESSPGQF